MDKLDPKILEIALQSLAAGEALPEPALNRSMAAVPYKYGMHLPNWFNGDSPGLRQEVEATLPVSLTFLDNAKGEGLNPNVEILHARGVKPWLVFRPYFRPDDGINPAIVEGYASGAVIRMRDDYFRYPLIRQAYDEGRFIVKLFNETNIGGEGFPRGRAGFADALRYWKQARAVVKAAYPNAKFISLCNTPGNDDVWFTGDQQNAPYWYHGPEAAKPNPTAADVGAAIISCPFREMFELADYVGIHLYGNTRRTVDGDLATWYSRRHEQALKFLGPYIRAGKKLIINEWDLGYDDGQEYRAEAVVYGLEHIVGPNDAILFVSHWWNADKNEGSFAWDKHRTREDGVLLPVVHAVRAFRDGATTPPPPDNPPPPPDNPVPPTGGTITLPAWVTVNRVTVAPGQQFWKLQSARYQDDTQSGGLHHIFIEQPHDATKSFNVSNGTTIWNVSLDKPLNEPAGNFAMFAGNVYAVKMNGLPSDTVIGMKMPSSHHVNYLLEYALVTQPTGVQMIDLPSNHHSSRAGQRVKYVILHSTASPTGSTLESTAQYLKQNERGVSIHELVGDNTVYRMVADANAAHHAESETARLPGGEPNYLNNELTWGIEGFQLLTAPVSANVARLMLERVVAACRRLGIPSVRVLAHREIDPTRRTDPLGIDMVQFRRAVAEALGENVPVPPPPPPPDNTVLNQLLLDEAERRIALRFNPSAALQRAIFAGDMEQFTPNSPEFTVTHDGRSYVGQRSENGRGVVRIYYAQVGDWGNVRYVERAA